MKIFRGTKNLSPLKVSDYYSSNGQFGPGMYFGSEPTQPHAMSKPWPHEGRSFRVIGEFVLTAPEEFAVTHQESKSQSHKHPDCRVEISEFEVVIKNPQGVKFDLVSLTVGLPELSLAEELVRELSQGEIEDHYGELFDVTGLDPSHAERVHAFLVRHNFKII